MQEFQLRRLGGQSMGSIVQQGISLYYFPCFCNILSTEFDLVSKVNQWHFRRHYLLWYYDVVAEHSWSPPTQLLFQTNIAVIGLCVFCVVGALLVNPWTALLILSILAMMVVELMGFMGLAGLKLNPISVVSVITAGERAEVFFYYSALAKRGVLRPNWWVLRYVRTYVRADHFCSQQYSQRSEGKRAGISGGMDWLDDKPSDRILIIDQLLIDQL